MRRHIVYFGKKIKIVTIFSYVVWPSAMKFGIVRDMANRQLFPKFRELWSKGPAIPCGDMHQSFTDALVHSFICCVTFLLFFGTFYLHPAA